MSPRVASANFVDRLVVQLPMVLGIVVSVWGAAWYVGGILADIRQNLAIVGERVGVNTATNGRQDQEIKRNYEAQIKNSTRIDALERVR